MSVAPLSTWKIGAWVEVPTRPTSIWAVPLFTRTAEALASDRVRTVPAGPNLPKVVAERPEASEVVAPSKVSVLTEVGELIVTAPVTLAFCWLFQLETVALRSAEASARQAKDIGSWVRKPSPRPVREAETRISPRTARLVPPKPCPATKLALRLESWRSATPAPGVSVPSRPEMTRDPVPVAARVVTTSESWLLASGLSSRRPLPVLRPRVAKLSVVLAALLPLSVSLPPTMLTVPPSAAPRRLLTLVAVLSSARTEPDWTLKILVAAAEETKALPLPE